MKAWYIIAIVIAAIPFYFRNRRRMGSNQPKRAPGSTTAGGPDGGENADYDPSR